MLPALPSALVLSLIFGSVVVAAEPWVQWDRTTDRVVSHTDRAAAYPRARRLSNGEILLGYHHGGGLGEIGTWVTLRRSWDGATWSAPQDVEGPEGDAFWGFSNLDFIELGGGRMLLVTAGRGRALPDVLIFLSECARSELRLRFSDDYGVSWGAPIGVARGRGRLWEPSVVRVPDGTLEIYFANEAPDLQREGRLDQRIELIRSSDQGRTWSEPMEVSQHPARRNGMPSALVLSNGRVACAQEVVRDARSPWIAETLRGERREEYVAQERYGFGAAPFLLAAPDGRTLLAFHSGFQRPPAPKGAELSWMFSNIWVQRGDANAHNFDAATQPWPDLDAQTGAFFPSLMMKDEHTLVALASFITQQPDGSARTVVRWIEGRYSPQPPTAVEERIPVLAWGGPPASETTPERYHELAEAGFTHNFSSFPNADAMAAALDIAREAGIKQFISIPELAQSPEAIVARFKSHPALAGYYLRDEPAASDFPALAQLARRIQSVDAEHPCYINLFPNYATAAQLGASTYPQYLAKFTAEVPVNFVSFDHYPVVSASLRPEWYENLEQVKSAADQAGKPFWAFALAVAHGAYPIPTIEELRLQVFSDLAYGAQAIQYFTYWMPQSTTWDFHEGPIDAAGKRTPVYDRVKIVNEEIRGLSRIFLGAKVRRVGHIGELPRGTRAYEPETPIAALRTEGGAVVSLLSKRRGRFLAIVNRDFKMSAPLRITFDGSAKISEVRKDGSSQPLGDLEFARGLAAGDIVMLSWEAPAE
jgi:hypothetical protein